MSQTYTGLVNPSTIGRAADSYIGKNLTGALWPGLVIPADMQVTTLAKPDHRPRARLKNHIQSSRGMRSPRK